jgi:urease accessory protein
MAASLFALLQLADSAFPSGGFAHSSGLEAAVQRGELGRASFPLARFLEASLRQLGRGALPFVTSAHAAPSAWSETDAACELFVRGHVQNRASRDQGRALLEAAGRSFPAVAPLLAKLRARPGELAGHLAPAYGVVFATLGFDREATQSSFLHAALRGLLSAAVRLGVLGPLEAQRQHAEMLPLLTDVAARCGELLGGDAAQTAPVLEVLAGTHDRLYMRLFQS